MGKSYNLPNSSTFFQKKKKNDSWSACTSSRFFFLHHEKEKLLKPVEICHKYKNIRKIPLNINFFNFLINDRNTKLINKLVYLNKIHFSYLEK